MKQALVATILALVSFSARADYWDDDSPIHRGGYSSSWGLSMESHGDGAWVIPALIGGAIFLDLARTPRSTVIESTPIYVSPTSAPQQPVWYFCEQANGYYPYITSCPSGWQTVPATPPQ